MDVCPFIPIRNVTMEECVEIANKFAEMLAAELNVPSEFYFFFSLNAYLVFKKIYKEYNVKTF